MTRVKQIVANLKIVERRENRGLATKEGTLDEVMAFLADDLEEDYAQNITERDNKPWNFDYVLTDDAVDEGELSLSTRRFDPNNLKSGSIFYARPIRRVSQDRFLLWLDVEEC